MQSSQKPDYTGMLNVLALEVPVQRTIELDAVERDPADSGISEPHPLHPNDHQQQQAWEGRRQQGGGAGQHRQGPGQDQEAEHGDPPARHRHRPDRRVAGERGVVPPLGAEQAEQPVQVPLGHGQGIPQAEGKEAGDDQVIAAAAGRSPQSQPDRSVVARHRQHWGQVNINQLWTVVMVGKKHRVPFFVELVCSLKVEI